MCRRSACCCHVVVSRGLAQAPWMPRVSKAWCMQVYAGPLKGGSRAVVLFNRHVIGTQYPISNITVTWETLGYDPKATARVRDLFAEEDLGTFKGSLTLPVDIHDARMVSIEPVEGTKEHEEWRPWHVNEALVDEVRRSNQERLKLGPMARQAVSSVS